VRASSRALVQVSVQEGVSVDGIGSYIVVAEGVGVEGVMRQW
jgi:hypothetical protein